MESRVSIVITTYNRKNGVSASIDSALNQTYKNIEVIVVDDGSVDGTSDFLKQKYGNKINLISFEENRGASFVRNSGIDNSNGGYILVWDSDDILFSNALEEVMNIFNENQGLAVVSALGRQTKNGEEVEYEAPESSFVSMEDVICKKLPNNQKVRVVRKDAFNGVRYESKNIDFLVNIKLREKGNWYFLNKELGEIRLESDNISLTNQRKKTSKSLAIDREKYLSDFVDKYKDVVKNDCSGRIAAYAYGVSLANLLSGKKQRAIKYSNIAKTMDPNFKHLILYIFSNIPFAGKILCIFYIK